MLFCYSENFTELLWDKSFRGGVHFVRMQSQCLLLFSTQSIVAAHYTCKASKWCVVGTQLTFSGSARTHKTDNENIKHIWKLSGFSRRDGKLVVRRLTEHALQRLLMRLMLHSEPVSSTESFHVSVGIRSVAVNPVNYLSWQAFAQEQLRISHRLKRLCCTPARV